jgi:hypothetical protein
MARQPTHCIPRRLKLAVVEISGLAVIVTGVGMLLSGTLVGLPVVAYGADLMMRPAARRLPRTDILTDLIMRWRKGAGP